MAGIYIHIPFCKSRCTYCDFYSTTLLDRRVDYVSALIEEIRTYGREQITSLLRDQQPIRTIYFGGGTPSMLTAEQIGNVLREIKKAAESTHPMDAVDLSKCEITMEANPGDLTEDYLRAIREAGVNRLSIGIQSLNDNLLKVIGRRHTAEEAKTAVLMARKAGFDNISIDLIYALPNQTMEMWQDDVEKALCMRPEHISTYCLTYEEGTVLTGMRDKGEVSEADDETANAMYDYLCERLAREGYVHYEVSNFALPGRESRHNSSYWVHTPYIGLGAGAHGFDGKRRTWNVNDLNTYISGCLAHSLQRDGEVLTAEELHEEDVMLGLRTAKGIPAEWISQDTATQERLNDYISRGLLAYRTCNQTQCIHATQQGIHILNTIISDIM